MLIHRPSATPSSGPPSDGTTICPARTAIRADSGDYNVAEIAALFRVIRPTVYRSLDRTADLPPLPAGTRLVPDVTKYDRLLTRNLKRQ